MNSYWQSFMQALNSELGKGKYKVIELENRSDCAAIQDYLASTTGARSVPRVFIGGKQDIDIHILAANERRKRDAGHEHTPCSYAGKCIGGGSETTALKKSGELQRLLKELGLV